MKVEVSKLIVRGDLELADKPHQLLVQLTLEEGTFLELVILSATVVLFFSPSCREGQQFFVTKVEQYFVGGFLEFNLNFVLNFQLLIYEVQNEVSN